MGIFLLLSLLGCGEKTIETPVPSCPSSLLAPGSYERSLTWEGVDRWYEVMVPTQADVGEPLPVVLNLHPFVLGGDELFHDIWRRESGLVETGEAEGFIVVQPDGTGDLAAWNAGEACCGDPVEADTDDVGFLREIVRLVAEEACVDEDRVYSTGMSNGGYMSHRLACEAPDLIAAIAPVVGSFSEELVCESGRAVPVLQISGSEDGLASRTASVDRWREIYDCPAAGEVTYQNGTATCETWGPCIDGVEVTHCIVAGGGHCWFSDIDLQATPGCEPMNDIDTPEFAWAFLSRWSR